MKLSLLRPFRQTTGLAVLLVFCVLFLDITHLIPEKYFGVALWFQFVPSAIKYISAGAAALGFVTILILTLITGRTYCSFLCPLGIMQDIISRAGGRIKKSFRCFGYKKPYTILRYSILIVTLAVTISGGIYILTLLDPYSIFGRFMTYFGQPAVIGLNNLLAGILEKFDVYTFAHVKISSYNTMVYVIPVLFLLIVGFLSLVEGRLYCNSICPVGTFLGLMSKVSFLRIKFDESACTKCGRCAVACKSSCIDFLNKKIDNSRCVECFNCVNKCPDEALSYGFTGFPAKEYKPDAGKRQFIGGVLVLLAGSAVRSSAQQNNAPVAIKTSTVRENKTCPVTPPGSVSVEEFTSRCTACSLCISACPNHVLMPSVKEYGITGLLQPHMDYHKGFCAYECVRCLEVCPTGAIMPMLPEAKKLTKIGKAVFIRENCIVELERTACGACAESCPTKAVHMVPFEGNLTIPETADDICIGCGHCEYACPVIPYKAIFVDGLWSHTAAKKPVNIQTDLKHDDFPF